MYRVNKTTAGYVYLFANVLTALVVLLGVFIGVNWSRIPNGLAAFLALRLTLKNVLLLDLFLVAWIAIVRGFGLSEPTLQLQFRREAVQVTKACTVGTLFVMLFSLSTVSGMFTGWVWTAFWPVSIVTLLSGRYLGTLALKILERPVGGHRNVIIVGTDSRAEQLHQNLNLRSESRLLGFVRSPGDRPVSADLVTLILGELADLESILVGQPVDEVVIALPFKSDYEEIQRAIEICERVGVEAKYFFDGFQVSVAKQRLIQEEDSSFVALKVVEDDFRTLIKRCIDVAGSAFGLIVFSPLLLLIAAAIKVTSPGPVLFSQERYGLNKRSFRMFKFRSMVPDAERLQEQLESQNEAGGPVFKIHRDPRVTPIGRLLRRTSLDELPQLLNVLKGDMSLVGPRPLPFRDVSRFNAGWLMRRFSVKPGITCLWQIHGRSNTAFDKWIELDLKYIDNWSLTLDIKILAQTVPAVLFGIGAV